MINVELDQLAASPRRWSGFADADFLSIGTKV
jgi:hypothetical protein